MSGRMSRVVPGRNSAKSALGDRYHFVAVTLDAAAMKGRHEQAALRAVVGFVGVKQARQHARERARAGAERLFGIERAAQRAFVEVRVIREQCAVCTQARIETPCPELCARSRRVASGCPRPAARWARTSRTVHPHARIGSNTKRKSSAVGPSRGKARGPGTDREALIVGECRPAHGRVNFTQS